MELKACPVDFSSPEVKAALALFDSFSFAPGVVLGEPLIIVIKRKTDEPARLAFDAVDRMFDEGQLDSCQLPPRPCRHCGEVHTVKGFGAPIRRDVGRRGRVIRYLILFRELIHLVNRTPNAALS